MSPFLNTPDERQSIAVLVPGGIGNDENIPALLDLLRRLATIHRLIIYSFSETVPHPDLVSTGCLVRYAPHWCGEHSWLKVLYFTWRARRDHQIVRFRLVHGFWASPQGLAAVVISKLLHISSLISVMGGDVVYVPLIHYGLLRNSTSRAVVRWSLNHATAMVALTRYQQNVMMQWGLPGDRARIISLGVDLSRFSYHTRVRTLPLCLLFVASLNRVKDPFTLVKTYAILRTRIECTLTIIGADILEGEVQCYARKLGVEDKIEWRGQQPYSEIQSAMRSSDFLLVTSLYEGEAVVVMEAFASGLLVAGTKVGLLADVPENGVTVNPGDAEGLAGKVLQLLADPVKAEQLRRSNLHFATCHSAEWTFNQYWYLYDSLLMRTNESIDVKIAIIH